MFVRMHKVRRLYFNSNYFALQGYGGFVFSSHLSFFHPTMSLFYFVIDKYDEVIFFNLQNISSSM